MSMVHDMETWPDQIDSEIERLNGLFFRYKDYMDGKLGYIAECINIINTQQQEAANFEVEVLERLDTLEHQMEALRKIVGRYAVTREDKQELEASKKLWGARRKR